MDSGPGFHRGTQLAGMPRLAADSGKPQLWLPGVVRRLSLFHFPQWV